MTTVTPSDQAGAASAKRPATIPTQRSGQGLRLLVLGNGEDAAAFRARAAEAGAELAQRFSVRVTHVVIEEGVGEDDARVVRARGAGLPVMGLVEGARLVEEAVSGTGAGDEVGAGTGAGEVRVEERQAADGEAGKAELSGAESGGARARGVENGGAGADAAVVGEADVAGYGEAVGGGADVAGHGEARASGEGVGTPAQVNADVSGAGVEARGEVNVDVSGEADGDRGEGRVGVDGGDRVDVVPLIRPRAEVVPEPGDGGPSDVFAGSALEAMLQFPPLPANEFEGGDGGADVGAVAEEAVEADATGSAVVDVMPSALVGGEPSVLVSGEPSALMEATAEACACVEAECASEAGVLGDGLGADGVDVGAEGEPTATGKALSIAWALVPLVSLGLLTPVAIGYAAYRLRSRRLAVVTACYTVAIVAAFAVSAALPVHTRSQSIVGDLMTTCLAASWLGGTAQGFVLRRRVFGLFE